MANMKTLFKNTCGSVISKNPLKHTLTSRKLIRINKWLAVVHVLLLFLRITVTKAGETTYQTYCINLLGKWHTMYHINFFSAINWKFKRKLHSLNEQILHFSWINCPPLILTVSGCLPIDANLWGMLSLLHFFFSQGTGVSRHEWERNDFILSLWKG